MSNTLEIRPIPAAIACDLTAIDAEYREQHITTAKQFLALAQEVEDLPDGYAFRLSNDSDTILHAARFIAGERQCCPFFNFVLDLKAENAPLWLHLTGPAGVKQALKAELGHYLNETVAQAAGLR